MRSIYRVRLFGVVVSLLLSVAACTHSMRPPTQAEPWAGKSLEGFPYHPLVYHLDLAILAYQLYSQTLVWPFDPYYEEMARLGRDRAMAKVHAWAKAKGLDQLRNAAGLDAYRGPGVLGGFENNPNHDPILFHYGRLHPWSNSITNADGQWTEYMTPKEITRRIRDVYMCYRQTGGQQGAVSIDQVPGNSKVRASDASDDLLAFEGGTGDKGEPGQPASQSLMGFVLLRNKAGGRYDVHITFRGSRSGSAARAIQQAFSGREAAGNPDWITDLGYDRRTADTGARHITTTSAVSRGFAQSMKSILPQLSHCLKKVADIKAGAIPDQIYVTGHSLGGALAQHFVSAMLLGDEFGPGGVGSAMPAALRAWPWKQIKLITFSAPRAGDEQWARTLTEAGLDAEFFSSALNPVDSAALTVTDPRIVSRLLDARRPAGYRVLLSKDPITTEKVGGGGKHVGKTVYANEPAFLDMFPPPDVEAHEPWKLRKFMVDSLADPRTPATAWRYRPMTDLSPNQNAAASGSPEELMKLASAVKHYYSDNAIWFDHTAFDRDVELRLAIDRSE